MSASVLNQIRELVLLIMRIMYSVVLRMKSFAVLFGTADGVV